MNQQRREMADLQRNWYATHLSQKGLSSVMTQWTQDMKVSTAPKTKKGELAPEFIENEWKGFISAFNQINRRK